jgi:hypothetical protein
VVIGDSSPPAIAGGARVLEAAEWVPVRGVCGLAWARSAEYLGAGLAGVPLQYWPN